MSSPSNDQNAAIGFSFEARFWIVLLLSVAFYFIAGNSGSGWIYLLSASMLAVLIMGLVMPVFQVTGIAVGQEVPRKFVAGEQATIVLKLKPKPLTMPIRWFRLTYAFSGDRMKDPATTNSFIAVETLDQETSIKWQTGPLKRGLYPLGQAAVSSCFPIGLVWWRRRFGAGAETITVYPKTARIDGFFLFKLKPSMAAAGGPSRGRQSARQSTSTRGIREYVRGDSPRIVHWASSARTGRLLVRDFEAEGLPQFDLLLDLCASWQTPEQFELAVTVASSLLSLGHRLGIGPQLLLNPEHYPLAMNLPSMPPGIDLQMEILARVQTVGTTDGAVSLPDSLRKGERALVVIRPEGADRLAASGCYLVEIAACAGSGDNGGASTKFSGQPKGDPGILRSLVTNEEDMMEL